jgi:hypothetical protein
MGRMIAPLQIILSACLMVTSSMVMALILIRLSCVMFFCTDVIWEWLDTYSVNMMLESHHWRQI